MNEYVALARIKVRGTHLNKRDEWATYQTSTPWSGGEKKNFDT